MHTSFDINIAGIALRFCAAFSMEVPPEFRAFLGGSAAPDEQFTIIPAAPQLPAYPPAADTGGQQIYRMKDGWLRLFRSMASPDGTAPATRFRDNGEHTIYLPPDDLKRYQRNCSFGRLIAGEYLFSRHDAGILHSSAVLWQGNVVLFSGVSGAGKSTQAELWRKYLGAQVINGDRCVLRWQEGTLRGYGSPYCGSSGIYRQQGGKIAGIFLPEKAAENETVRLSPMEAFRRLYPNLTLNPWDADFMACAAALLSRAVETVPVFCLRCRPDEGAVMAARQSIL